jgi:hypothetical protein
MSGYNSPMFVDRGKEKEAKRDTRWERRKASIFDQNNDNMYKRQVLSKKNIEWAPSWPCPCYGRMNGGHLLD